MNPNMFRNFISTKAVSITAMWGFAYLGQKNESKMLIEISKNNKLEEISRINYYGYACMGTVMYLICVS